MTKLTISLSVALAFAAGCVAASRPFIVPPARAAVPQRWDYFCFDADGAEDIQKKLAKAGDEGWEVAVGIDRGTSDDLWCMKRAR